MGIYICKLFSLNSKSKSGLETMKTILIRPVLDVEFSSHRMQFKQWLTLSITINYDGYVNSLYTRGFNLVLGVEILTIHHFQ